MKKNKCYIIYILLYCNMLLDFNSSVESNRETIYCGVTGGQISKGAKSGWKFLKGCIRKTPEGEKLLDDLSLGTRRKFIPKNIYAASRFLTTDLEKINTADEITPKIQKYLAETKADKEGVKVIRCYKEDANTVRMQLYDNNVEKVNKIIIGTKESIRLANYDVAAMQEKYYVGNDGIEYVTFSIPKKRQYVLDGNSQGRVYECMVFNLPKDQYGNWERFRAFLIDLFAHPGQLWDEFMFRQELAHLNIQRRDVNEIEEYVFAMLKYNGNDEYIQTFISA